MTLKMKLGGEEGKPYHEEKDGDFANPLPRSGRRGISPG